ncbi:WD40/YVTN/BNR-like repeat-containing protein [Nocardioides coralli]|uniref:WD40/YVTN/BNR-like repeat-containing protein n=1 Tax=Nocardioides coralli TaxID=2872154 RepID=UPI001CA3D284|nr:oxidoreductase [Nocardioides coralli]QZY29092.1 oxidoreductase [Nocardioides coralli]
MRRLLGTIASLLTLGLAATLLTPPAHAGDPGRDPGRDGRWRHAVIDPDQSFRGLDAVDRRTAWVSGGSLTAGGPGRVYRTTDGGGSWQDVSPPGSEGLMFRDVEAHDEDTAVVLAIGEGEASRIYRTDDGGRTWTEAFRNAEPAAFYNCLDFYPGGRRGLAVSDPVDGRFRILATEDGGRSWEVLPADGMPDSTGEYNFSASGECLTISGRHAWFGTGGSAARVFHSRDGGLSWTATDAGIPAGEAAGVFGLAFRGPRHGIAVGGDFATPADGTDASAYTRDGRSWRGGGDLDHLGEDVAWLSRRHLVAVGEGGGAGGVSVSGDGGRTWRRVSDLAFHTLDCVRGACWAAGGKGRFGRVGR